MVSIIVVDDHLMMRQGMCALLNTQPDFQVVGDAGDGEEALRLVGRLHPDILVVDMVMPGINGIEVAAACQATITDMLNCHSFHVWR